MLKDLEFLFCDYYFSLSELIVHSFYIGDTSFGCFLLIKYLSMYNVFICSFISIKILLVSNMHE